MHPDLPSDPPRRQLTLPQGPVGITDEGQGPVIVAFHGYPGSVRDWRWLAPVLSPHHRLVRVDMPGFGETPLQTAPATTIDGRGDFALAVLDALGLDQATLLSHSLGGSTVLSVAARYPARVRALALLAPPGFRPHWTVPQARIRRVAAAVGRPILGQVLRWPLQQAFAAAGFSKRLSHAERVHTLQSAAALDFDGQHILASKVRQPCLVAWARDDRLVPPDICEELAQGLPEGPRLPLEDGGHNLQKTQAIEVGEALVTWLATLETQMDPDLGVPVCLAMVALVVLTGTWLIRRWLRRMAETLGYAFDFAPARVRLEPAPSPALTHPDEFAAACSQLEALGFVPVGTWTSAELGSVVLRGYRHPVLKVLGAAYDHAQTGVFADILALDGTTRSLTVTAVPTVSAFDRPPFAQQVHLPGASPAELQLAMAKAGLDWTPVDPGDFKAAFESTWALEMDWRCARGGPSRDEIRRVAEADGKQLDDAQVQMVWTQLHGRAMAGLDEILREAISRELPHLASQSQEVLLIHDALEPDEFWDELAGWFGQQVHRSRRPGSPRALMAELNAARDQDAQLRLLGSVTHPMAADVYGLSAASGTTPDSSPSLSR